MTIHLRQGDKIKCGARAYGWSRMRLAYTEDKAQVNCKRCLGTVTWRTSEPTEAAIAAKMIREELKAKYPGIKFRVTSETYSMGSSVNVHWDGGPEEKTVDSLIGKYEYGSFDGMTDSYNYTNVRKDLPQVKFAFATRAR